ncbi:hypothetical protein GmRootV11_09080 [Variovorax sp. V11]
MAATGPWVISVKSEAGCVAGALGSASTGITRGTAGGGGRASASAGGAGCVAQAASSRTKGMATAPDRVELRTNGKSMD